MRCHIIGSRPDLEKGSVGNLSVAFALFRTFDRCSHARNLHAVPVRRKEVCGAQPARGVMPLPARRRPPRRLAACPCPDSGACSTWSPPGAVATPHQQHRRLAVGEAAHKARGPLQFGQQGRQLACRLATHCACRAPHLPWSGMPPATSPKNKPENAWFNPGTWCEYPGRGTCGKE
jgi:hypothetical protein